MTTEDWFKKFVNLERGDVVSFRGLRLVAFCISSFGGAVFTAPPNRGGEVIPVASPLWDDAEIVDKETVWVDSVCNMDNFTMDREEPKDPANWWRDQ